MSMNHEIPNDNMAELVCSSCNNYLSIFPIFLSNNNCGAICGRCTPFNRDEFIQDVAYEVIAEFLHFPCCYAKNGCQEKLPPHRLEKHEPTCPLRFFKCPSKTYTRCEWLGLRADLIEHFEQNHLKLLLKTSEFNLYLGSSIKEDLLLPFEDELFIVKKDFDTNKKYFSCSVERFAAQSTSDQYNYVIKLLSSDRNSWCKLSEKSTEDGETVTVNEDYIKQKLEDPTSVVVKIEIFKGDKPKQECPTEKITDANLNWELLNELECPVCFVIMSSGIYQCTGGHSICSECKLVIKHCPLCRKDVLETRNYALEKVAIFLTFPCKFHTAGCSYTAKRNEIKKHEKNCEFGPLDCPLKEIENCQAKINRSRIADHFEKNHDSLILKSDRITSPFKVDFDVKERIYLIKFSGKIFLVTYKYESRKFYWIVQLLEPVDDCKEFKFDIDIIDNSKRKLRCYLKGFCLPFIEEPDFENPEKCIMLTYEQLQHMISANLDYSIHIIKE